MGKESMGEFLESAVASVLHFRYKWQTVIENYHLLRPNTIKKKHEPKVSSIEIDVFGFGSLSISTEPRILAPKKEDEILLIQCKDEWYEHEHEQAINFLNKAEKIAKEYYPKYKIRKIVVTLLISPDLLKNKSIENNNVYFICNVARLRQRIERGRKYNKDEMKILLNNYLKGGRIGDLRDEIVKPLLEVINENINIQNLGSLTNFPSLALQSLRFLVNLTCFSDEDNYLPFISEKSWRLPK